MIWVLGTALTVMVGGLMWLALRRAPDHDAGAATEAPDAAIYRDQLAEIARDRARGILPEAEAERARAEVARRLLAADARAATAARRGPALAAMAVFVLLGAGALGLYAVTGAPGYPDMALDQRIAMADTLRASRPDQATREAALPVWTAPPEAEESYLKLVRDLRTAVATRPGDLQGLELLVRHEAALGNMRAARLAQARVVDIKGADAATGDLLALAGLSVEAAGGYVTPEAEAVIRQVLDRDPMNGVARYYIGLMHLQTGRPDLTFRLWEALVRRGPADAPWVQTILPQMSGIAELAGARYDPPQAPRAPAPTLPGPDADAVAAAQDMTAEERQTMIRGMVEGLSERLATEGGGPEEWARLIGALAVLGEADRARAIHAEARDTFGTTPEALALIDAAAERAGIAE